VHILQNLPETRSTSQPIKPVQRSHAANRAGNPNLEEVSGGLHDQNGKQYNQIRLSTASTSVPPETGAGEGT
jgi:LAS superfamily LD-carboxypeptidase LdcB